MIRKENYVGWVDMSLAGMIGKLSYTGPPNPGRSQTHPLGGCGELAQALQAWQPASQLPMSLSTAQGMQPPRGEGGTGVTSIDSCMGKAFVQ